ncbi:hypothetical protein BJX65DRAFT_307893 [Aspergillus insuetus]
MVPMPSILTRLKNHRSRKPDEAVSPQPHLPSQDASNPANNASTVAVAADPDSDHDNPTTRERLWNEAYDSLKRQDSELVAAYEKVLSRELAASSTQSDAIESENHRKRQAQMEDLVQTGMKKVQGRNDRVERAMQSVLGVSSVIGTALQPVLVNATTHNRSLHEGVSYVATRMGWYCELSQLLLRESTTGGCLSADLQSKFKDRILDLYTELLSYLMKSVCSRYQSRVYRYFQITLKLNDWEGGLREIQEAEQLVQNDMTQFSTQQVRLELEELAVTAQNRHKDLLTNIHGATLYHAAQTATTKRDELGDLLYTSTYCRQILAAVAIAYRPLTLDELGLVAKLPAQLTENLSFLEEIVDLCGNFLDIRQQIVYFVHHSAKEYLSAEAERGIFPNGRAPVHSGIVSRGLDNPDPLRYVGYTCVYWIKHLLELGAEAQGQLGLHDGGAIDLFVREHFLHWLEALSLLRSLRTGEQCVTTLIETFEKSKTPQTPSHILTL